MRNDPVLRKGLKLLITNTLLCYIYVIFFFTFCFLKKKIFYNKTKICKLVATVKNVDVSVNSSLQQPLHTSAHLWLSFAAFPNVALLSELQKKTG